MWSRVEVLELHGDGQLGRLGSRATGRGGGGEAAGGGAAWGACAGRVRRACCVCMAAWRQSGVGAGGEAWPRARGLEAKMTTDTLLAFFPLTSCWAPSPNPRESSVPATKCELLRGEPLSLRQSIRRSCHPTIKDASTGSSSHAINPASKKPIKQARARPTEQACKPALK